MSSFEERNAGRDSTLRKLLLARSAQNGTRTVRKDGCPFGQGK